MAISVEAFRDALRQFSSGVTIVTIKTEDDVHGLTIAAFTSVSAEPPLISVVINSGNRGHSLLTRPGAVFAVNILREDQRELADCFAWKKEERFAQGIWDVAVTGAPVLKDALAWLDCTIYVQQRAGTHTLFIGEVQASHVNEDAQKPLIYWNRDYRQLTV